MVLMIICVCNRINAKAVADAIAAGADAPDDVQAHHGCAFNCGACRSTIHDMIENSAGQHAGRPRLIAAE
jgi:bacterioferritin-associated ferredoxin